VGYAAVTCGQAWPGMRRWRVDERGRACGGGAWMNVAGRATAALGQARLGVRRQRRVAGDWWAGGGGHGWRRW
jgi:hypothetical protein